jgi:flavin reductase (DIM6/NTAB) family NADH-FMN oxidoreductase RutF
MQINPKEISTAELHSIMLSAVAPRPIAFASTIDTDGNINLSPFSFFNCFSASPPILIFSPARRVRDNTTKHTLENCLATKEVVINTVNYDIVEQMSLASTEYEKGVNEFIKSGLTPEKSTLVKPPRVAESPVSFECKVLEVKELGNQGGAGNLIICEIVMVHIKDKILNEKGKIDQRKIDLVARLGGDWYSTTKDSLFEIPKPILTKGIGVDALPENIRNSEVLTGNNLGRLGNIENLPTTEEIEEFKNTAEMAEIFLRFKNDEESLIYHLHNYAKELLEIGNTTDALKVLLCK